LLVDETVRREKALDFSGCKSRPGIGSLHPVAIETAAEATNLSELSNPMKNLTAEQSSMTRSCSMKNSM